MKNIIIINFLLCSFFSITSCRSRAFNSNPLSQSNPEGDKFEKMAGTPVQDLVSSETTLPSEIPGYPHPGMIATIRYDRDITLDGIDVYIKVTHKYIDELVFELEGPSGSVVLRSKEFVGPNANLDCWFVSSASSNKPICASNGSLDTFLKHSGRGRWTLKIQDTKDFHDGTLESFKIDFRGRSSEGKPDKPKVNQEQQFSESYVDEKMPLKENWRLFGGSPLTPLIDWTYGPERRGLYRRNDIKMSGRQVPLLRNNFSTDPETKTIRGSFIFESFGGSFEVALYLGAEVFYIRPGTEVMTAYSAKVGRRLGLSGPEQYFALQEIKLNKEKNNTESIIISELTSGVNFVSKSSLGPNNFSFRSTNKGSVCALFNGVELCADGKKINEKGTVGFSFTESARFRNEDDPKIRFEEVFGYSE